MSWRTKSKSGWLADGKPTSISLKPICTSGLEHPQLAGRVHRVDERLVAVAEVDRAPPGRLLDALRLGQVRSASGAASGENGRYFSNGIGFGVTFSGGIGRSLSVRSGRKTTNAPCGCRGRGGERGGALAAT